MLENPWDALERRMLGGAAQQWKEQAGSGLPSPDPDREGRGAVEGAMDRPWH